MQVCGSQHDLPTMSLISLLKRQRESFLDRHYDAGDWRNRMFSAATYSLWRAALPVMTGHCRGLVLDAGSGRGAWRSTILERASSYESLDIGPRGGDQSTWVGDLADMPQVPTARFDTVVCHQVLEHLPRPWLALAEMRRVLKPGGKLIVSVPHLSRLHELPHDYFRYTPQGMQVLLADCGFVGTDLETYGGVLCFLHHQFSFLIPGLIAGIPVIGSLAIAVNSFFSWSFAGLDCLLDRRGLTPLGVIATARKPL